MTNNQEHKPVSAHSMASLNGSEHAGHKTPPPNVSAKSCFDRAEASTKTVGMLRDVLLAIALHADKDDIYAWSCRRIALYLNLHDTVIHECASMLIDAGELLPYMTRGFGKRKMLHVLVVCGRSFDDKGLNEVVRRRWGFDSVAQLQTSPNGWLWKPEERKDAVNPATPVISRPRSTRARTTRRAMLLGQRVRERRQALGWSRNELSKRTGVSNTTLSRIEYGVVKYIPDELMDVICQGLSISLTELLDGTPVPTVNVNVNKVSPAPKTTAAPEAHVESGDELIITPSLRKFAVEEVLSFDVVERLAAIPKKGKAPTTVAGWRALYQAAKAFIQ